MEVSLLLVRRRIWIWASDSASETNFSRRRMKICPKQRAVKAEGQKRKWVMITRSFLLPYSANTHRKHTQAHAHTHTHTQINQPINKQQLHLQHVNIGHLLQAGCNNYLVIITKHSDQSLREDRCNHSSEGVQHLLRWQKDRKKKTGTPRKKYQLGAEQSRPDSTESCSSYQKLSHFLSTQSCGSRCTCCSKYILQLNQHQRSNAPNTTNDWTRNAASRLQTSVDKLVFKWPGSSHTIFMVFLVWHCINILDILDSMTRISSF